MSRIRLFTLAPLFLVVGCGTSGPELADVSGKITLDGKPIPAAGISFLPNDGKASPAYGGTNAQGQYSLQFTRDKTGAMLGSYDVVLEPPGKVSKAELAELKAQGLPEPPTGVPLPKKYKKLGALKATVKSGANTLNFELTSN